MTTKNKSTKEIWKPIKFLEGKYEISNLGRVKRFKIISPKGFSLTEKILKNSITCNVYSQNALHLKCGKRKTFLSHRLVMNAFCPNVDNKTDINHINGIKTDNSLSNLEWCTRSENMKHAFKIGLACFKGEKQNNSKLTELNVLFMRKNYKVIPICEMARRFNVSECNVSNIIARRSWLHI